MSAAKSIRALMGLAPVIPVLTLEDPSLAGPLAKVMVAAGLTVLEVTLRTPAALEAISEMTKVEGAIVGAGTVRDADSLQKAKEAGARFAVSPGLTRSIAEAAKAADMAFLPGVATASEILRGLELGLTAFKFFPAEAAGGIQTLSALAAPFAEARFCPTGGVTAASAPAWLALPSVLCVGGSWIAKGGDDLATVERRARQAAALARAVP
ncbi:MAG: bifunctional 4-hydroxy-2-oxoglutarate aldolase/2-dehydro-3-deoxy-phosphogluconate aldolase [Caulobacteraceae bacterium]